MIVCCGEALIDFIPARTEANEVAYVPKPGGSPFNAALTLGRLGARVGFMGGLSSDFFGTLLRDTLAASGVDLGYVVVADRPSTLAFVSLGGGEPQYAFFDESSASRLFDPSDAPALSPDVQCLQVGSISLVGEPAASRIERLFLAERGRRVLSIDPNIRPSVVPDPNAYRARMAAMIAAADLIKISRADLDWLQPGVDHEAWAQACLHEGAALVVLTAGGEGALAVTRTGTLHQPAERVRVIDTVGAGDAFTGGLLAALQRQGVLERERLRDLGETELASALRYASRVAALTCTRAGADPPREADVAAGPET